MIALRHSLPRLWAFFFITLLFGLVFPSVGFAQPFVVCDSPPSGSDHWALGCTAENLLVIPVRIFNFLLSLAAFVLLAVIVAAGIRMMWFHLTEAPESELQNAKLTLSRGIVGFTIVVGAVFVVNLLLGILTTTSAGSLWDWLSEYGIYPTILF